MNLGLGLKLTSQRGLAFSPLNLSPAGWYDPSDLSTLWRDTAGTDPVTADGQAVARIDDKSGNGLHFVQPTSSARPLYKTSGGLHWLLFDQVDDFMYVDSLSAFNFGTTDFLIAMAFRQFANGGNYKVLFGKTDNSTGANYRCFIRDDYKPSLFRGTDSQPSSTSDFVATQGSDHFISFGRNASVDRYGLNADRETKSWAAAGTGSTSFNPTLFADGNDGSYFTGGRFYGAFLKDENLSDGDYSSLRTWLGAKAGLSL